ncbi:hypothetical protein [Amycolatopsis sp. NBC_01286]|uniref:hypothetical protein n=1 Tax=Amycolatopsis sp. NBC_01286 TaxID=2903560 RepID=UPI002E11FAF9|nr:hypothetical protein OG570_12430 [Amycolatopsis sp. NBC_01286]
MLNQTVRSTLRHALGVILPVGVPILSFLAAANQGAVKAYLIIGVIVCTAGSALLAVRKEIRVRRASLEVESSKERLRISLAETSQPLVAALGHVSASHDLREKQSAIKVLLGLALKTLRGQCGCGSRESYRSCFYLLDGDRLVRVNYEGRPGETAPRKTFDPADHSDSDRDRQADARNAVDRALGEDALLVKDLHVEAPSYMVKPKERSYRTMLSVPVNADAQRFGLLSIDSPEQETLKDIDRRYIMLIAGVLAAGLAQLKFDELSLI